MSSSDSSRDLDIRLPGASHEMLVLRNRYELASTANDLLIGLWFLVGSILFFWESTVYYGTWLFVIGSAQLLARPAIRIARRVHLERSSPGRQPHDSHDDY